MSSYLLPLSVSLQYSDSKFPSSNCTNLIISPVVPFGDVSYGMYDTSGYISIASEYGCDTYNNSLEKVPSKTTSYEDTILCLGGT